MMLVMEKSIDLNCPIVFNALEAMPKIDEMISVFYDGIADEVNTGLEYKEDIDQIKSAVISYSEYFNKEGIEPFVSALLNLFSTNEQRDDVRSGV